LGSLRLRPIVLIKSFVFSSNKERPFISETVELGRVRSSCRNIFTVSVTKSDTVYATSTLPTTVISTVTAFFADTMTVTGTEVDTTTVTTSTFTFYHKRQVTDVPSAVPTYASPRSGVVKYSSACSCLGITETTIIVAAPVSRVPNLGHGVPFGFIS
jgi:hypothetical protein